MKYFKLTILLSTILITLGFVQSAHAFTCGDNVTFNYKGQQKTYGTVTVGSQCWMDRNLGATKVATSYNDCNTQDTDCSYGDYFQWGRLDDGHQEFDSSTTSTNSPTTQPGHNDFITETVNPYDWLATQDGTLWQYNETPSLSYLNNPCPAGWHVPTQSEWGTYITNEPDSNNPGHTLSECTSSCTDSFADSTLKIPSSGYRSYLNGALTSDGIAASYWSNTPNGGYSDYLSFSSTIVSNTGNTYRAYGFLVRCIYHGFGAGGPTATTTQDFTIGDGNNAVTVDASANNPDIVVNGDFVLNKKGTFVAGSGDVTVGTDATTDGDFTLEYTNPDGSTWTAGTGKLILVGGDNTNLVYFNDKNPTKQNLGSVQIGASPTTINMSSDMTADNLTVSSGDRLNTRGYDITLTDYMTVNGYLDLDDTTETDDTFVTLGGNLTVDSGATWEDSDYDSEVVFTGNASANQAFATGGKTYGRITLNNDEGTYDDVVVSGNLTMNGSTLTITDGNLDLETSDPVSDINSNVSIGALGTLTASSTAAFNLSGNWANAGVFTPNSGAITFDATATGKTIDTGGNGTGKAFNDIVFNNSSGGWTLQTNSLQVDNDLTFTSVSSWAMTKTLLANVDGTLSVAANQDIRMWNTTSAAYSVDATGSLYSQNSNNSRGDLGVWGDYHTTSTDYWSAETDFDGTSISSAPRQVNVRIDPSSGVIVDSGDTLNIVGTSSLRTDITRQGGSGGYTLATDGTGGTLNFQYANFHYLEGSTGLNIQAGATVTDLSYLAFDDLVDSTAYDSFITVVSTVIGSGTPTFSGVRFNNTGSAANYNVKVDGSPAGYWTFSSALGTFAGEDYDGTGTGASWGADADPGYIHWTLSAASEGTNMEGTIQLEGHIEFQ